VFVLHQHHSGSPDSDTFDEYRLGLDHIAYGYADRKELEEWLKRLEELGIPTVGSLTPYGSGLAFRDPDNIQLEFFAEARGSTG
jgi:catechol 2,3-dioxygenase-like lactoylglutathione lyase family enzyme